MANVLAFASLGLLSYLGYQGLGLNPQSDNYQVTGSNDSEEVAHPAPVYSAAEDGSDISGIGSQVPNPTMRMKRHRRDPLTYHTVMPNGNFKVKNIAGSDHFHSSLAASSDWLRTRPSSVPISQSKRSVPNNLPRTDTVGRAYQYVAAADTAQIASVSLSMRNGGARRDQVKTFTDMSRGIKSYHLDTLYTGTVPAYAMDPESPHGATSFFTQSFLGMHATPSF